MIPLTGRCHPMEYLLGCRTDNALQRIRDVTTHSTALS
jgi:hypothetical protein